MDLAIKSFVGMFFLMLIALTGVGFIGASITSKNADAFLTYAVDRIENSDYADAVIDECVEQATAEGYSLQTHIYGTVEKYGSMTLTYRYTVPILGIDDQKTLLSALC